MPGTQADKQFTNKSIEGTYGFTVSGTVEPGSGPLTVGGLFTYDGNGGCFVKETLNAPSLGGVVSRTSKDCTYNVNPDGTGTQIDIFEEPFNQTVHISFVVVDKGNEIRFIITDPGLILSGVAKRQ